MKEEEEVGRRWRGRRWSRRKRWWRIRWRRRRRKVGEVVEENMMDFAFFFSIILSWFFLRLQTAEVYSVELCIPNTVINIRRKCLKILSFAPFSRKKLWGEDGVCNWDHSRPDRGGLHHLHHRHHVVLLRGGTQEAEDRLEKSLEIISKMISWEIVNKTISWEIFDPWLPFVVSTLFTILLSCYTFRCSFKITME